MGGGSLLRETVPGQCDKEAVWKHHSKAPAAYQIQPGLDEVEGAVAPDPFDLAPLADHLDLEAVD